MAIVLDNDLLTRWLDAQRAINETQELRDTVKTYTEKDSDRISELEKELRAAQEQIESLEGEVAELKDQLAVLS